MMETLLGGLAPVLGNIAEVAFVGMLGWGLRLLTRGLSDRRQQRARDALLPVVELVAGVVRERIEKQLSSMGEEQRQVIGPHFVATYVRDGADYVTRGFGDALRQLGTTSARVDDMIRIRAGVPLRDGGLG